MTRPHTRRGVRRAVDTRGQTPEAVFQAQVVQLAGFYGWLIYHTHDSRRSQPGFPDLVLVRGAELLFVELKTASGRVRPEQQMWLDALRVVQEAVAITAAAAADLPPVAVESLLWRPADWDALHARLARGRQQVPTGVDPRR